MVPAFRPARDVRSDTRAHSSAPLLLDEPHRDSIEIQNVQLAPYTERSKRKSFQTVVTVGELILFVAVVFGMLFGAGTFLAGSREPDLCSIVSGSKSRRRPQVAEQNPSRAISATRPLPGLRSIGTHRRNEMRNME